MKISHINVNIYDKTVTSQQNSDYDVEWTRKLEEGIQKRQDLWKYNKNATRTW
jgi:hypothetical protein